MISTCVFFIVTLSTRFSLFVKLSCFVLWFIRWIYFGQNTYPSEIFRINFDGTDKRIIVKDLPSYVYGIGVGM